MVYCVQTSNPGYEWNWDETTLKGSYLLLPASAGCQEAPLFRKQVQLKKGQRTLIHVNSLGYHEVYVNGQRLGHQVLAPAMTQLDKRSAIVTYDATDAGVSVALTQGDVVSENGKWYVRNSQVDFTKFGRVKYDGKTYTVMGGKVVA